MADLSVLKNIVRTGRVSSVNAVRRTKGHQEPAVHSGKGSGTEDGKRKRRKR